MKTVVSSKGQVVLPAELRELDRIVPGQQFEIERVRAGRYVLVRTSTGENEGMVDWLLACPIKDWFVPIPSDTTDSL